MPPLDVTEQLQAYLVAQGVGEYPDAADGNTVTIWLDRREGAPQPLKGSELEPATVMLRASIIGRPNDLDYSLEETFVDVIVRARQNSLAKLLQRQIFGLLVPWDGVGGRPMWMMGDLLVERSIRWRGDQALGSDEHSYDRTQSFMFACRRKVLDGLTTYTP